MFNNEKKKIVAPHRKFVKEAVLKKVCRKDVQKRMVWLFNDLLVYTRSGMAEKKFTKPEMFSLLSARVEDLNGELDDYENSFVVFTSKKSFTFVASSAEEKKDWVLAIRKSIETAKKNKQTFFVESLNAESGEKEESFAVDNEQQYAPHWIPDKKRESCMKCEKKFNVIVRRHHCRACGWLVCGDCSKYRATMKSISEEPVRVCRECFDKISN